MLTDTGFKKIIEELDRVRRAAEDKGHFIILILLIYIVCRLG